jgi:elongation factor G
MAQEQEKEIAITSVATACCWTNYRANIIESLGHMDLIVDVEHSFRALNSAGAYFTKLRAQIHNQKLFGVKQTSTLHQTSVLSMTWIELGQIVFLWDRMVECLGFAQRLYNFRMASKEILSGF